MFFLCYCFFVISSVIILFDAAMSSDYWENKREFLNDENVVRWCVRFLAFVIFLYHYFSALQLYPAPVSFTPAKCALGVYTGRIKRRKTVTKENELTCSFALVLMHTTTPKRKKKVLLRKIREFAPKTSHLRDKKLFCVYSTAVVVVCMSSVAVELVELILIERKIPKNP